MSRLTIGAMAAALLALPAAWTAAEEAAGTSSFGLPPPPKRAASRYRTYNQTIQLPETAPQVIVPPPEEEEIDVPGKAPAGARPLELKATPASVMPPPNNIPRRSPQNNRAQDRQDAGPWTLMSVEDIMLSDLPRSESNTVSWGWLADEVLLQTQSNRTENASADDERTGIAGNADDAAGYSSEPGLYTPAPSFLGQGDGRLQPEGRAADSRLNTELWPGRKRTAESEADKNRGERTAEQPSSTGRDTLSRPDGGRSEVAGAVADRPDTGTGMGYSRLADSRSGNAGGVDAPGLRPMGTTFNPGAGGAAPAAKYGQMGAVFSPASAQPAAPRASVLDRSFSGEMFKGSIGSKPLGGYPAGGATANRTLGGSSLLKPLEPIRPMAPIQTPGGGTPAVPAYDRGGLRLPSVNPATRP